MHHLCKSLTDYSENEYQKIRAELLQNQHGQNHWFVTAHLLGHIEPVETFKSLYHHLSYIHSFGQKLLNIIRICLMNWLKKLWATI